MLDIEKIIQAQKTFTELEKEGVIAVYHYIHLKKEKFLETFPDYKVRAYEKYKQYELSAYVDGIEFMCLSDTNPKEAKDESSSEIQNDESPEAEGIS